MEKIAFNPPEPLTPKVLRRWARWHYRRAQDKSLTERQADFHITAYRDVLSRRRRMLRGHGAAASESFDWRNFCSTYSPQSFSKGDTEGKAVEDCLEDIPENTSESSQANPFYGEHPLAD